jgi:hypothetical protein
VTLFDRLTPGELEEVQRRVGGMILMLPVTSGQLGHATAAATIRGNYLVSNSSETNTEQTAKEFVNDLFKLKTAEMCQKWFGDSTGSDVRRRLRIIA